MWLLLLVLFTSGPDADGDYKGKVVGHLFSTREECLQVGKAGFAELQKKAPNSSSAWACVLGTTLPSPKEAPLSIPQNPQYRF